MLDQPLPQVTLDGALVEDARRTFSRVTLAERVYSAIQNSPQATALPPWRPSDALGATGVGVFMRRSGKPMTDGIPGFFTVDGFYKVLLPQLPVATRQVASESWVLGKQSEVDPNSPQVLNLQNDVVEALHQRLRQAVGRDAERHRCRAADQSAAGGAGRCMSCRRRSRRCANC